MKKILSVLLLTSIMTVVLSGCLEVPAATPTLSDNLVQQNKNIAVNQQTLEQKQPAPRIEYSNERANLIKRAKTFNDPNKLSYIYLLSDNGNVLSFYVVKGKVSNISSYLVPDQQIVKDPYYYSGNSYYGQGVVIQSPDIDGSYGTNGEGIFFYTADDTYVEWNGKYMLCDKPLKMSTQPTLIREVK